jgi:acetyl esterase/lipase
MITKRHLSVLLLIFFGGILFMAGKSTLYGLETAKDVWPMHESRIKFEENVSYLGNDRKEKLDIYLPDSEDELKLPVILFIHGGGWEKGSKSSKRSVSISKTLAENGYAVFCIDYKLTQFEGKPWQSKISDPGWPQNIYDCKTAVRFIRKNAVKYRIDPDRIAVMGCSAGGHMALLTGMSAGNDELNRGGLYRNYSCDVSCIIDMYGIPDVRVWGGDAFLGLDSVQFAHQWELASPVTHLSDQTPPILILHGDKDETVGVKQSVDFVEKLKAKDLPYEFVVVKGGVHSFDLEPPQIDLRPVVMKFLNRYLKNKPGNRK